MNFFFLLKTEYICVGSESVTKKTIVVVIIAVVGVVLGSPKTEYIHGKKHTQNHCQKFSNTK